MTLEEAARIIGDDGYIGVRNGRPVVIVINPNKAVIEQFCQSFGGTVYEQFFSENMRHYRWSLQGRKARSFLSQISTISLKQHNKVWSCLAEH